MTQIQITQVLIIAASHEFFTGLQQVIGDIDMTQPIEHKLGQLTNLIVLEIQRRDTVILYLSKFPHATDTIIGQPHLLQLVHVQCRHHLN
jgi:hypothetical protein